MSEELSYQAYVKKETTLKAYSEYQQRYAKRIRESDKVLIEIIHDIVNDDLQNSKQPALLDLGCSTGNLLLHLKHALPGLTLTGVDIIASVIEECKSNPDLTGIHFEAIDMLNLTQSGLQQFDVVVTNASLMFFNEAEFSLAIQNIATIVKSGGWFVAFDLFHPFEQEVAIIEKSRLYPEGLKFYFRGYGTVKKSLHIANFVDPIFTPFHIPIDLPQPAYSDITTYTVRTVDGKGMSFRGSLFQPWCHLVVQKGA